MTVSTRKKQKSIPTNVIVQLYQSTPEWGDEKRHGFRKHTWYGAIARANRRAGQLLTNCAIISKKLGRYWHYPYDATIKVLQQQSVNDHRKLLKAMFSKLKRLGCVFAWDMEVSRKNLIDVHLTFRDAPEELMRDRGRKLKPHLKRLTKVKLNIQVREIKTFKDCYNHCNYVTKAKRLGFAKKQRPNMKTDDVDVIINTTDAKASPDIHARKRVLFVKGCGLHKDGHSDGFWEQDKKQREAEYKQRKQAKQQKMQQNPYIEPAAKGLAEITDFHEEYIERQLYAEIEAENDHKKKADIRKQHKELANAFYQSTPELQDELRYESERQQKQKRQREDFMDLDTHQRQRRQERKPFNPDGLESFTLESS